MLPTRDVRARYGNIAGRTVRRWVLTGVLPPPDRIINRRNFWWESTLLAHERRLVGEKSAPSET
jgi:hypothetical protein